MLTNGEGERGASPFKDVDVAVMVNFCFLDDAELRLDGFDRLHGCLLCGVFNIVNECI